MEGDTVRGQLTFCVDSLELSRGGMEGGILREGEGGDGRIVGEEEGGEIWDVRGGAGVEVETGDEVAEITGVVRESGDGRERRTKQVN